METIELLEKLSKKYPSPQYGFITKVRNGTGFMSTRTADAIAMSLWPSRGLELIGFELKISREDWLRELKNPSKADEVAVYCDRWYIVASSNDIVKKEELPPTWGLLVATDRGISMKVEASKLEPIEMDRVFLAGIFRNVCDKMIARELIQKRLDNARKDGEESVEYKVSSLERDNEALKNAIIDFEKKSGVKIDTWDRSNIGKVVKEVLSGRHTRAKEELVKLRKTAVNIVKYIDDKIQPYEIK